MGIPETGCLLGRFPGRLEPCGNVRSRQMSAGGFAATEPGLLSRSHFMSDYSRKNCPVYTGAHKKVISEITIMASVRRGW